MIDKFFFRWLFPFIGHMGIALSSGVIRDFAGSYYVSVRMYFLEVSCVLQLDDVLGG